VSLLSQTKLNFKIMKPLMALLTIIASVYHVEANFHISNGVLFGGGVGEALFACPSNNWDCSCFADGNGQIGVNAYGSLSLKGVEFFYVDKGLCGMGQLNFYLNDDKTTYNFYVNDGDGSLQGQCWPNSAGASCSNGAQHLSITDQLVCYSYICGS